MRKHLTEVPTPPRQTAGGANIDPRLEALFMRSLAKEPNDRFANILELRDGLALLIGAPSKRAMSVMTSPATSSRSMPLPDAGARFETPRIRVRIPARTRHRMRTPRQRRRDDGSGWSGSPA